MSDGGFAALVEELLAADDDALLARLHAAELSARRVAAEQAAITREVERRGLHTNDGHTRVTGWLRAELRCSGTRAGRVVRTAKLLDTVPGAGDALLDGRIGVEQAQELASKRANPRSGDRVADFAEQLLGNAEQMEFKNFKMLLDRWESLADTDGAEQQANDRIEHRDAVVIDAAGELFMRASGGSALDVAELTAIFDSFTEHQFALDCAERDRLHGPDAPASLLKRTDKQRRRDALQAIFRSAREAVEAGLVAGPTPMTINLIVSQYDAEHALAGAGLVPEPTDLDSPPFAERRKQTVAGSPVGDADVVRALVHGKVRSVAMDCTGMPISYGRTRRLFTGPIRDVARLLGHSCSHPGCGVPAERCEIDHIIEYSDGGETAIGNAGLECSSHNRFKHRTKLTRTRHGTDRIVTTRANGTIMHPAGRRTVTP